MFLNEFEKTYLIVFLGGTLVQVFYGPFILHDVHCAQIMYIPHCVYQASLR